MTPPILFTLAVESNGIPPIIIGAVAAAAEKVTSERTEDTPSEAVVLSLIEALVAEVSLLPEVESAACSIQGVDSTGSVSLKLRLRLVPTPLHTITIRPFDPSLN
jgi:hypothetical protein